MGGKGIIELLKLCVRAQCCITELSQRVIMDNNNSNNNYNCNNNNCESEQGIKVIPKVCLKLPHFEICIFTKNCSLKISQCLHEYYTLGKV